MIKSRTIFLLFCSIAVFDAELVFGATIPAGTTLVVRTSTAISSRDATGRKFQASLTHDVKGSDGIILPAGTMVTGVIQSPQVRIASTHRPLTLRLIDVQIGKQKVGIKTAPFEAQDTSPWTGRHGRTQITGSAFLLPSGTILPFRLTQPVNL